MTNTENIENALTASTVTRSAVRVPVDATYRATYGNFWGEAYGHGATEADALESLRATLAFNLEHNGVLI